MAIAGAHASAARFSPLRRALFTLRLNFERDAACAPMMLLDQLRGRMAESAAVTASAGRDGREAAAR